MPVSDDRTPRYRLLRATGAMLPWHPCEVCGDVDAPYGYGVRGPDKLDGSRWFCGTHRPVVNEWGKIVETTTPAAQAAVPA